MSTALEQIAVLAAEQIRLEDELATLEALVKAKAAELRGVSEERLPHAMDMAEVKSFMMADGSRIEVKSDVAVGITVEDRPVAFQYLRDHDAGSLIKRDIIIEFGRDQDADAAACVVRLAKAYPNQKIDDKATVHPGTLKKWVKETLEQGRNFPMELFGVRPLTAAKVTRPKVIV